MTQEMLSALMRMGPSLALTLSPLLSHSHAALALAVAQFIGVCFLAGLCDDSV